MLPGSSGASPLLGLLDRMFLICCCGITSLKTCIFINTVGKTSNLILCITIVVLRDFLYFCILDNCFSLSYEYVTSEMIFYLKFYIGFVVLILTCKNGGSVQKKCLTNNITL